MGQPYVGTSKPKPYAGTSKVKSIYRGTTKIWSSFGFFFDIIVGSASLYIPNGSGGWTTTSVSNAVLYLDESGTFKKVADVITYYGRNQASDNFDKPHTEGAQACWTTDNVGQLYYIAESGITSVALSTLSSKLLYAFRLHQHNSRYLWVFGQYYSDPQYYYGVTVLDRQNNYERVFWQTLNNGYSYVVNDYTVAFEGYIIAYSGGNGTAYYQLASNPTSYFTAVANFGSGMYLCKHDGYYYHFRYTSLYRSTSLFSGYTEFKDISVAIKALLGKYNYINIYNMEIFKGTMVLKCIATDYDGEKIYGIAVSRDLGTTWSLLHSYQYDNYTIRKTADKLHIIGNWQIWLYTEDGINWTSITTNMANGNLQSGSIGYIG